MKKMTATILSVLATAMLFAPAASATPVADAATPTKRYTAVTDGYAAVSSGNMLYLFNEENGGVWQEYVHDAPITEPRFDGQGNLYFLGNTSLYRIAADAFDENAKAEDTGVDCDTYTVAGDTLYYADLKLDSTLLYRTSLQDTTTVETHEFGKFFRAFACDGQALYGLEWGTGTGLYALNLAGNTATQIATLPTGASSLTVADSFAFTTTGEKLYGVSLADPPSAPIELSGSFQGLSAYQNQLYLLQGSTPLVYTVGDGATQPALGAFTCPTEQSIPTGNVKAQLDNPNADFSIVDVAAGSLLIEVDMTSSQATFTRVSSRRTPAITALKIAETEGFALINYRENAENAYKTYLVDSRRTVDKGGLTAYDETKNGYLTSAVRLYKFPDMDLATLQSLSRGEKVTLLGEIHGLDCDYYAVLYGEQTGYVPAAYVTASDTAQDPTPVTAGDSGVDKDAVWRLVYLLLGAGAICILADFLILRKKRDE